MTPEESNAKLRRLVPWLGGAVVAVVIGGVALALATKREGPWVLVAADVVFTLVLLIALWRRQVWARYLLIGLFGLAAIGGLVMVPNTLDPKDRDLLMAYVAGGLLAVGSALYLYYSRDIHRLTSRDRE